MPAGKGGVNEGGGGGAGSKNTVQRKTFRPPWVKEGPDPLPAAAAPWTLNKVPTKPPAPVAAEQVPKKPNLKPVPPRAENGTAAEKEKKETFVRPQLKPVPPKETKLQSREVKVPIKLNSVADRELPISVHIPTTKKPQKPPSSSEEEEETDDDEEDEEKDEVDEIDRAMPATRNALVRQESSRKLSAPSLVPAAPPMPPKPPPAPAMPLPFDKKPLSKKQLQVIEMLKVRPKVRPDWTEMLKEVESGRKLKHVHCNDRSQPILPDTKAKEHFLYESEKPNVHNELLKQIQRGINLKIVKTNDRSKPMLQGLRKFRRQMTIEEQIQKSQSMASIPPEEIADEADEMDDIDKVRDDLQSTKQLLAFELRNKEAQMRENKRLLSRIQALESELDNEKRNKDSSSNTTSSSTVDEKVVSTLKSEAADARKTAAEIEKKYTDTADQLDSAKTELEAARRQNLLLEKRLQDALQGGGGAIGAKRQSLCDRKDSVAPESEDEEEEETETESDGEDNEEKQARRAQREMRLLRNKLRTFKTKEDNAKKERMALKDQMKNMQAAMKDEKKKFKSLQKEVDKMASLMRDVNEDEDEEPEDEDEDKGEESDSESESSESESDSSEGGSESEKSLSEPEDAPEEKKKENITKRSKRHENILAALKKGNYMLKANVERLQDDLNKQKEMTISLQRDLDSVLAELG